VASAENRYRKIETRMWTDEKFHKLSPLLPSGQSLWFYLLTGPHTGIIPGLCRTRRGGLIEELDWTPEAFDMAFGEIISLHMAEADWKAGVIWIPNAVKCNPPQSPNVITAWRKEWPLIPECALKTKALEAMRSTAYGMGKAFREAFDKAFDRSLPKALTEPSEKPLLNQEQQLEQLAGTGNRGQKEGGHDTTLLGTTPQIGGVSQELKRTLAGLTEFARGLMEEIAMPNTSANLRAVAAGIKAEEKARGGLAAAYEFVLQVTREEIKRKGSVSTFWFTDAKWRQAEGNVKVHDPYKLPPPVKYLTRQMLADNMGIPLAQMDEADRKAGLLV
jgi:hypothetical protein